LYRSWSLGRSIRPDTQNQGAAAPDKVGDTMAKAVNFLTKYLSIILMCVSVLGGIAGMWTSVQAANKSDTNEKVLIESRLSRLETKMDLILTHFKIESK
jgi:hypothetical protein